LESGILDLHKELVPALQFVAETVNIFTAQARQHDVALDLILKPEQFPADRGAGALPLMYCDQFSCDRYVPPTLFPHIFLLKPFSRRCALTILPCFLPASRALLSASNSNKCYATW
jgi:hypothetical protein